MQVLDEEGRESFLEGEDLDCDLKEEWEFSRGRVQILLQAAVHVLGSTYSHWGMINLGTSLKEHMSPKAWSVGYRRNECGEGGRRYILAKKFGMSGSRCFPK